MLSVMWICKQINVAKKRWSAPRVMIREGVGHCVAGSPFGPKIVGLNDTSIISRIVAQDANFVSFREKVPGPAH